MSYKKPLFIASMLLLQACAGTNEKLGPTIADLTHKPVDIDILSKKLKEANEKIHPKKTADM